MTEAKPADSEGFGPATKVELSSEAKAPAGPTSGTPSPAAKTVENVINVDQETRTVVFQSRNASTGDVVFQIPDESKLKLRAYLEEMAQHTANATAGTHPDPSKIDSIRI